MRKVLVLVLTTKSYLHHREKHDRTRTEKCEHEKRCEHDQDRDTFVVSIVQRGRRVGRITGMAPAVRSAGNTHRQRDYIHPTTLTSLLEFLAGRLPGAVTIATDGRQPVLLVCMDTHGLTATECTQGNCVLRLQFSVQSYPHPTNFQQTQGYPRERQRPYFSVLCIHLLH